MSDLGPVSLENQNNDVFLGRDWGNKSEYSEDIAAKIDAAVREIVNRCYIQAKEIIAENRLILERSVDLLIEQETIEGDVFRQIVADNTEIKVTNEQVAVTY
jgi:cell division protease FtsH